MSSVVVSFWMLLVAAAGACKVRALPSTSGDSNASSSDHGQERGDSDVSSRPPVPEPNPPAFVDDDGVRRGPGGPISDAPRDCSAANNHCLRGNGWMAGAYDTTLGGLGVPAFEFHNTWYSWDGDRLEVLPRRTAAATLVTVMEARDVYVFRGPPSDKATVEAGRVVNSLPRSELEALTARRWIRVSPYTVDADAGTFVDRDGLTYRVDGARIGLDE